MSRRVDEMLGRAVAAHRGGAIAEAIALYRAIIGVDPKHVEALQLCGAALLRTGDAAEAVAMLDRALARDGRHVPALVNRGSAYKALGDWAAADASLARALAIDPDRREAHIERVRVAILAGKVADAKRFSEEIAARWPERVDGWRWIGTVALESGDGDAAEAALTRAVALAPTDPASFADRSSARLRLGRIGDAVADAERAVALAPGVGPIRLRLAEALAAAGDPKAEAAFRTSLALEPGRADAIVAFGSWLRDAGRDREAVAVYQRGPAGVPEVQLGLGNALRALGDVDGARAAWQTALAARPAFVEAAHNVGASLCEAGQTVEGIGLLAGAAMSSAADWPWIALVDAIGRESAVPAGLVAVIAAALDRSHLDHQQLERAIRAILARVDGVADALQTGEIADDLAVRLVDHPLFAGLLARTIVVHPQWERLLVAVRRRIADAAVRSAWPTARTLRGAVAIARQAWHTEYAWGTPAADRELVGALAARAADGEVVAIAAAAMYGPVRGSADPAVADLVCEQITEPAIEAELAAALPVLAMSDDATSIAVRAMYEENPYPRLVAMHRKLAEPLARVVRTLFPAWRGPSPPSDAGRVRILVAGCGTGQQPLAAATRYCGAEVLAIDLSRRSIAAAARRARAWGLDDLRFGQADILALGGLTERFHLVEAGGVLHHLADPMAGWRVLVGLLVPGGWMKIALYSERGRPAVIAARALVAERGLEPSPDGLIAARRLFLDLPDDHPARPIVHSPDFYSLSGLRDLVFHVQEHRFSLEQLDQCLKQLNLTFVGFQHPRPEPAAWYREAFPDDVGMADLGRWDVVERSHPEVFAGMYQFWACDAGGTDGTHR